MNAHYLLCDPSSTSAGAEFKNEVPVKRYDLTPPEFVFSIFISDGYYAENVDFDFDFFKAQHCLVVAITVPFAKGEKHCFDCEVGNLAWRCQHANFKANYKILFLFFLTVLFCCSVGENGGNIRVGDDPFHKLYKKCAFLSVSCLVHSQALQTAWQ